MSLNAKNYKTESKFPKPEPLSAGAYPARVVQILGLGLQKQNPFKGVEKPPKFQLMVVYELLDEFMLDEEGNEDTTKPRWIREDFPMNGLDSDLATSTKRYTALDPEMKHEGDWAQLGGTACTVTLVRSAPSKKDGTIYNNVGSVSSMRQKDADKAPELVNPVTIFDYSSNDTTTFLSMPDWIQAKVKEALDFDGSPLAKALEGHSPSDKKEDKSVDKEEEKSSDDADW